MAEHSGFFQSMWDDELQNPITQEYTGWWDRDYDASFFRDYFGQFISNGVFGTPTNQLKVVAGTGLNVIVTAGWAMINGAIYHNDVDKIISIPANSQSSARIDSIKLRYSESDRQIIALGFTGDVSVSRGANIYDLKLAEITVNPGTVQILDSNITDTRLDENVCGLVVGVLSVETTADLFAQYQSQFNQWFDTVKNQVTGDLAIRLQMEFDALNGKVDDYQDDVTQEIAEYHSATETILNQSQALIADFIDKDYVIPEQALNFVNKVCTISDSKVTANSLIDVYFTSETIEEAEECQIVVDSSAGAITLTSVKNPESTIRAMIRVRVR